MIHTGLVSITFRKLSPKKIVDLVTRAGLESIEWGGDVHVPHGNLKRAGEACRMTVDAGLKISSYGSYYYVGHEEDGSFSAVLDTAVELKAPAIRVWAGKQGSRDSSAEYRNYIVSESRRIADLAGESDITIAYEFHSNTLTDTNESAVSLLKDTAHDNIGTYWQPPCGASTEYYIQGLRNVLPWLSNIHVFQWKANHERQLLADGGDLWRRYLSIVMDTGRDHFASLEFVKEDAVEVFLKDAETLKEQVKNVLRREKCINING